MATLAPAGARLGGLTRRYRRLEWCFERSTSPASRRLFPSASVGVLEELAKHAPSFVWGGLAFWTVYPFRTPIAGPFPRLRGFKAAGVEMSFVERSMAQAAAQANRNNQIVASTVPKGHVAVTRRDRERVLERADRSAEILKGKRVLWLDDLVANNRLEREMLEAFGVKIEQPGRAGRARPGPQRLRPGHLGHRAGRRDRARRPRLPHRLPPKRRPPAGDLLREPARRGQTAPAGRVRSHQPPGRAFASGDRRPGAARVGSLAENQRAG